MLSMWPEMKNSAMAWPILPKYKHFTDKFLQICENFPDFEVIFVKMALFSEKWPEFCHSGLVVTENAVACPRFHMLKVACGMSRKKKP